MPYSRRHVTKRNDYVTNNTCDVKIDLPEINEPARAVL